MSLVPYALARPFLFGLDPEEAHDLTLAALARIQRTPLIAMIARPGVRDPVTVAGLTFPNRFGLAAGLDKNARCIDGLAAFGFGFIEVGTVTPKPQPGNPKPRMFRIPQAQALVNRLGFNNAGLETLVANVRRSRYRARGGILGINIGKNAATAIERAVEDYVTGLEAVYAHADYVAVNISSPNTANLRSLQSGDALDGLLGSLQERRRALAARHGRDVPMFVKIAPDLDTAQIAEIACALRAHAIQGVIATNTTLDREAVHGMAHAQETGGLSGAPLRDRSNRIVRELRAALGPRYPIIGVGGILSGDDARAKLDAGADLVQIYTGLIYRGPELVGEVAKRLSDLRA